MGSTRSSASDCRYGSTNDDALSFTFRIDRLDAYGDILEHIAGIEDFELAVATYEDACKRWPSEPIMLRQGARVVKDSRKTRLA